MGLTQPDHGWAWIVLIAACVIQGLVSGINLSVGITQVALQERFNNSVTYISWANGIYLFFNSAAGVLCSAVINRYSCRTALLLGSLIMTSGLAASAVVRSIEVVLVTYGVIAGVGSGIVYTAQLVVIGFNFESKRSMATGIAAFGAGFGVFIFPPLFQLGREIYGNNGLFFIQASVSANISVFGSLCFSSTFERKSSLNYKYSASTQSRTKSIFSGFFLLSRLSFLFICVSMLASHVGINMVYVHLTSYSISLGTTNLQASLLTSVIGLTGSFGRLLIGMLGNVSEIPNIMLYFGTYGVLGLATVLLQLYTTTYTGQMVYSSIFGMNCGCCYVLLNTITPQLVGIKNLASAFGMEMFFTGAGSLIGVVVAGIIIDSGGTYEAAFTLAGASILVAAMSVLVSVTLHDNKHTKDIDNREEENAMNPDNTN